MQEHGMIRRVLMVMVMISLLLPMAPAAQVWPMGHSVSAAAAQEMGVASATVTLADPPGTNAVEATTATYSISGKVTDGGGNAVSGVTVTAYQGSPSGDVLILDVSADHDLAGGVFHLS